VDGPTALSIEHCEFLLVSGPGAASLDRELHEMANIGSGLHGFKAGPEESFNPEFSRPLDADVNAIGPLLRLLHCTIGCAGSLRVSRILGDFCDTGCLPK
jgi:hypothetical protein